MSRSFTGERFTIQDMSTDANQNGIFFEPLPAGTYSGSAPDTLTTESDGGRNGATAPGLFQLDLRTSYNLPVGDDRTLNFGGVPPRTAQIGFRFTYSAATGGSETIPRPDTLLGRGGTVPQGLSHGIPARSRPSATRGTPCRVGSMRCSIL